MTGRARRGPVVALDVDGVIRVLRPRTHARSAGPESRFALEAVRATYTVREDQVFNTLFHAGPQPGTHSIVLAAGVGDWVNRLLARGVEVVWASTWEHTANWHIGPLLNIPELPVATVSTPTDGLEFRTSPEWKTHRLLERYRGRDVVWVDDNLPWERTETLEQLRSVRRDRGLTLTIAPNPRVGLTTGEIAAVDDWLAAVATPEGRARLRAERGRELRRDREREARRRRRGSRRQARIHDSIQRGLSVEATQLGLDAGAYQALLDARAANQEVTGRRQDLTALAGRAHFLLLQLHDIATAPMGAEQAAVFTRILDAAQEFTTRISHGEDLVPVRPHLAGMLGQCSQRAVGAALRRVDRLGARLERDDDLRGSWIVAGFLADVRTALEAAATADPNPSGDDPRNSEEQ